MSAEATATCVAALAAKGITDVTVVTHAAVLTADAHAAALPTPEGPLAKNLFVKSKKKVNYLLVVEAGRKVNMGQVGKLVGAPGLRVDQKGLAGVLAVAPGAVTPLAVLNDSKNGVIVVLDKKLDLGAGKIGVHPLTNEATAFLSADNVKAFVAACGNEIQVIDMDADPPPPQKKAPQQKKPKQQKKKKGKESKESKNKDGLTASKAGNFALWYQQVVVRSGMIGYYDISGCYIFRPWSYRIWEFITAFFDAGIKKLGVQNAYFPLFVTKKALCAEEDHIEGFAVECAWVTKSGQSDLADPIAIRPTSETIMYPAYSKWIRSHRDLPLKLNQWTNVVRWEFSNPTPFIRSREFLWQEGHSAFATREEAEVEVLQILNLYAKVYTDLLAMPVTKGKKTEREKFAGGLFTTTVEAFVPETGRGIQGATSHCLGTNFAKIFDIKYLDTNNEHQLVWQNSWGLSTRSIGAMVMVHGDDKGLVLPPTVAPIQIVIVPILFGKDTAEAIIAKCHAVAAELKASGHRVEVDDRPDHNPGWKFFHWELKGVPLRLEVGPKDLAANQCQLVRRVDGKKSMLSLDELSTMPALLKDIYDTMYQKALAKNEAALKKVTTWDDFMTAINARNRAIMPWCGREPCEEGIKKRSQEQAVIADVEIDENDQSEEAKTAAQDSLSGAAKSLCVPLRQPELPEGTCCVNCGQPAVNWTMFGRSY